MKKLSINLKYLTFSFTLIIASFAFASNASAASYQNVYTCSPQSGGGNIISFGDMVPGGPFSDTTPQSFTVSANMSSTCTTRTVSLKGKNNAGAENYIIPTQTLIQGDIIGPFFETSFNTNTLVAGNYAVNLTTTVEEDPLPPPPPASIGNVFAIGPWFHGAHSMAAYVGQPVHPALTVRVKRFGKQNPYINTTNPAPDDDQDCILNIPAGNASTPMPQMSSNYCSVGVDGSNYGVVSSVTGANVTVGTTIPSQYHVCRYNDAPSVGMYFTPSTYNGISGIYTRTCGENYPDAEVVY